MAKVLIMKMFNEMKRDDPKLWERWAKFAWAKKTNCLLARRYREWMSKNWPVFDLFMQQASLATNTDKKFSIQLLAEGVRWTSFLKITKDDGGFRLNNSYTAFMARDLILAMPGLKDVLICRAQLHHEDCVCALIRPMNMEGEDGTEE